MLGIGGNSSVVTGPEIDDMTDDQLRAIVNDCNIFARASPENKLRIVKALQTGPGYGKQQQQQQCRIVSTGKGDRAIHVPNVIHFICSTTGA